ncbi:MAG: C40 family peptidase [candidate division KSB1 bacterium]|nr:C40 family peptidase [candidate division KSB1 bacterium]MDZ7333962.1 C40 family peptidase [candidate division KSB1 bacterium]MDZ7356758.1 C40 family peptidase [candidate division KSB1 bacterium]MDZ7375380.1 C40 family peptidase [candidate division KSB1 bacterium]MDZ7399947.1 C40 family peptidase [candidate division KSB1 bacterium]
MKNKRSILAVVVALAWFAGTSNGISQQSNVIPDTVLKIVQQLEQKYQPDRRISRFDVQVRWEGDKMVIFGETITEEGKTELLQRLASETSYQFLDSLVTLPDSTVAGKPYGIVRISVAQLRRQPDEAHEIVDQAMMGSEVRILKIEKRYWAFCQLDDQYLGWMTISSLVTGDWQLIERWRQAEKLIVTANYGQIWEKPSDKSVRSVSDVVRGNLLIQRGKKRGWYHVELPDGRSGYIRASLATPAKSFFNAIKNRSVNDVITTAYQFIGLPYLWGGRSTKGFDCSGFTQTVFKLNGIDLPRDANMQVKVGEPVALDDSLAHLRPGDLLFFGKDIDHIIHVGMYIGDSQFIHSDGMVRINSFNPKDENYSSYRRRGLQAARRVIIQQPTHGGKPQTN